MGSVASLFLLALAGGSLSGEPADPGEPWAKGAQGEAETKPLTSPRTLRAACEALESEYDRALSSFRQARYRGEFGERSGSLPDHPVHLFWPRFEILAKQGLGRARLWMLTEVQHKNLGAEEVGAWKARLLGELLGEDSRVSSMGEPDMLELVRCLPDEGRWLSPRLIEASLRRLFQESPHLTVRGTAGLFLAIDGGSEVRREVQKRLQVWLGQATPQEAVWILRHAPRIRAVDALAGGELWDAFERALAASEDELSPQRLAEVVGPLWVCDLDRRRLLVRMHRELHGTGSSARRLALGEALAEALFLAPRTPDDRAAAQELYAFVQAQAPDSEAARRVEERLHRGRILIPGQPAPALTGVDLAGKVVSLSDSIASPSLATIVYFGDRDARWKAPPSFAALAELQRLEGVSIFHVTRLSNPGLVCEATLLSPDGSAQESWGVREETAFVFGPDARLVSDAWLGEELLRGVRGLLGSD